MPDWKESGFLGDDPWQALRQLQSALQEHVLPFLADWWSSLAPVPTEEEVASMRRAIVDRAGRAGLPPTYAKIPELLCALAASMRFNRRNYVNVHPSPFVPSALASFVVALQNPNNIVEEVSKPTTALERDCVDWVAANLFGIRETGTWGNVVSGGTIANMTALLVARDYTYDKLSRPRPGRVGPRGVIGLRPGIVLGTAGTHYSVEKALWFLGIGHENLIRVPVCWDEAMRIKNCKEQRFIAGIQRAPWKELLADAIENDEKLGEEELKRFYAGEQCPFGLQPLNSEILKTLYSCFEFDVPLIACVLTLGTTDTGTIERVDSFAIDELRKEDIFIHVDAASGGFAFVSEVVRDKMNKLGDMDSFTVDPHKMGFLHYPCGVVLFRSEGFRQQIYHEAPYLGPLAPTLEGSRPGTSAAALWLAKETIGVNGYHAAVGHILQFTKDLVGSFAASEKFQVLHKVDLNAVAVAPIPLPSETRLEVNELVRKVRERVVTHGEFMINLDRHLSGVKVANAQQSLRDDVRDLVDIEALRIVVTNPLVAFNDAERLEAIS